MALLKPAAAATAVLAVCAALSLVLAASALGAEPPSAAVKPSPPRESLGGQITSFYFGKNNQITPVPPFNESHSQQADALGVSVPRALISNVGTWAVTLSEESMIIETLEGVSIWASSDQGAQNVRFTINVELNGNPAGTLNTETKGLSATPEEFRLDGGSSQLSQTTFPRGAQLSFNLQYRASSSPLPVGPSADSTFLYYGNLHRSRVDLVTNPFNLTLADMKMERSTVNVTEIVKDAFSVDIALKTYFVTFNGPTNSQDAFVKQVDTKFDPINGTTLIWNWDFARQGTVSSGDYAISLSARYLGADSNYTNVSSAAIEFPKERLSGGGFLPGLGALEGVAAVAAAATLVALSRRAGRPPRRP